MKLVRRLVPTLLIVFLFAAGAAFGSSQPCQLGNKDGAIQHVVYIQFDNTHLRRDLPGVPSDLEQIPHLLNFLQNNGTVLNKHYTILISHTAGGILSSFTGLYPDRMGITVSNSYDYYDPSTGFASNTSGFKYWTAPVAAPVDNLPNMVNGDSGSPTNTPAPWVAYTRNGCDVGNVSSANMVLENNTSIILTSLSAAASMSDTVISVGSVSRLEHGQAITVDVGALAEVHTIASVDAVNKKITLDAGLSAAHAKFAPVYVTDPTGDMTAVFGEGSSEWVEGKNSQLAAANTSARALAQTDFVGIAVHCGKQATSLCHGNLNARTDALPDEPNGYSGFQGLFGAKYVNPAVTGGGVVVDDLNGNPIVDPFGNPGFPGFDSMPASTSLGYIAQLLEAGVPVVFAYISDAHDNHAGGGAYGPGEAGYVAALQSYDQAFGAFFQRLANDGIDKSNTLFIITADENDHFAGQDPNAPPFNQNCDGVTKPPCVYNTAVGNPQHGIFDVTSGGVSPFVAPAWPPAAQNGPLVGEVGYNIKWSQLVGPTINGIGYDISFDSAPSFYINNQPQAVDANGNIVVNSTLRAFEQAAANLKAFDPYVDDTDLIPVARYLVDAPTLKAIHMINADGLRTMPFTMFSVPDFFFETFSPCPAPSQGCVNDGFAWIHGDYSNDIGQTWLGIVGPGVKNLGLEDSTWTDHTDIVPTMMALLGLSTDYQPDGRAITQAMTPKVAGGGNGQSFQTLGSVYKQLNAPYGDFNHSLIVASTNGIKSDDVTYVSTEQQIQSLTAQRDVLVVQMKAILNGGFQGHQEQLIRQGQQLLAAAAALAGS
jgi:hypothetical protein